MNFIGIDVHLNSFVLAVLNEDKGIKSIMEMGLDDLIEYIKKVQPLIIAVDAPYGLHKGFMNDEAYRRRLNPSLKGHREKKVSEYELSRRGFSLHNTPGDINEATGWKSWMKNGFNLYDKLHNLGYERITTKNNGSISKGIIEVFPHTCFGVLLGYIPPKKTIVDGINIRIDILKDAGIRNIEEGEIVLPTIEVKDKYKKVDTSKENRIYNEPDDILDKPLELFEYEYTNVDSIIWLKYFKPVKESPGIYSFVDISKKSNIKVYAEIQSEENESIEVYLQPIKNSIHGLKVIPEYKEKLKSFWGTHGNRRKYRIRIGII